MITDRSDQEFKIASGDDSCGPKEPIIRWGQGQTDPFAAARGNKRRSGGISSKCFYQSCSLMVVSSNSRRCHASVVYPVIHVSARYKPVSYQNGFIYAISSIFNSCNVTYSY